jgi:hypothetical protein
VKQVIEASHDNPKDMVNRKIIKKMWLVLSIQQFFCSLHNLFRIRYGKSYHYGVKMDYVMVQF